MIVGIRDKVDSYRFDLHYIFPSVLTEIYGRWKHVYTAKTESASKGEEALSFSKFLLPATGDFRPKTLFMEESSMMVDGIGGIVWEGSWLMCDLITHMSVDPLISVIELGSGTGICGIVAAIMNVKCLLTDREVDLTALNIERAIQSGSLQPGYAHAIQLEWGSDIQNENFNILTSHRVIMGVEITCLMKQQSLLVDTINKLYTPNSIVLMSFDSCDVESKYEKSFRNMMKINGYLSKTLFSGSVKSIQNISVPSLDAYVAQPVGSHRSYITLEKDLQPTSKIHRDSSEAEPCVKHFIEIFYKQSASKICSRCNNEYFDALNNSRACEFHEGFYVCRKHPAEIRCSVDGFGDGLGYYGNGTEGIF